MIAWCRRRKLPLVVVGSAGGRTDPTQVRVRDLSRTEHDALLALVRKKLRAEFNFPRNAQRYFSVPAVYSLENVKYPQSDGSVCGTRPALGPDAALKLDCGAGLGAATHVTGAFAFAAVARAKDLLMFPRTIPADEALALGLVSRVVARDDFDGVVTELATSLAAGPTLAYGSIRRAVGFSTGTDLESALAHEAQLMALTGRSADHRTAVDAFLAKEQPTFSGR